MDSDKMEALLAKYMEDPTDAEPISEQEEIAELKTTYAQVRRLYKSLKIQKQQAERMHDVERLRALNEAMRQNWRLRWDTVKRLRELGEYIEDPFVDI